MDLSKNKFGGSEVNMLRILNRYWQNQFLKTRIVLMLDHVQVVSHPDYGIVKMDEQACHQYADFLTQTISWSRLMERIRNPDCAGFLAICKRTGEAAGYEWCVVSDTKMYRHDKFAVPLQYGLLFHAFVHANHRNKGVFRAIKSQAGRYLLEERGCKKVLSVVESLNTASLKANDKLGSQVYGKNYLVKCFGRNLWSVTKAPTGITIDYVGSGKKSRNL